jgi:hypothetical protein
VGEGLRPNSKTAAEIDERLKKTRPWTQENIKRRPLEVSFNFVVDGSLQVLTQKFDRRSAADSKPVAGQSLNDGRLKKASHFALQTSQSVLSLQCTSSLSRR